MPSRNCKRTRFISLEKGQHILLRLRCSFLLLRARFRCMCFFWGAQSLLHRLRCFLFLVGGKLAMEESTSRTYVHACCGIALAPALPVCFCLSVAQQIHFCAFFFSRLLCQLATAILDGAQSFPLPLVGLAIGNGWVDPLTQTSVYGTQAFHAGLIDQNELEGVNQAFDHCSQLVTEKKWAQAQVVCDGVLNNLVVEAGNINVDDTREWNDDEHDNRLEIYLSNPLVAAALGLVNPPVAFSSCSSAVGIAFSEDEMIPSVGLLPRIFKEVPHTFLYEGIFDLLAAFFGSSRERERERERINALGSGGTVCNPFVDEAAHVLLLSLSCFLFSSLSLSLSPAAATVES